MLLRVIKLKQSTETGRVLRLFQPIWLKQA